MIIEFAINAVVFVFKKSWRQDLTLYIEYK